MVLIELLLLLLFLTTGDDDASDLGGRILHQATRSLQQTGGGEAGVVGATHTRMYAATEAVWLLREDDSRAIATSGGEPSRWESSLEGGRIQTVDIGWPKGLATARETFRRRLPILLRNAAVALDLDGVQEEIGSLRKLGKHIGGATVYRSPSLNPTHRNPRCGAACRSPLRRTVCRYSTRRAACRCSTRRPTRPAHRSH